jgi:hypothetical protein
MAYHEVTSFAPLFITTTQRGGEVNAYLQELAGSEQFLSQGLACVWLRINEPGTALPEQNRENALGRKAWIKKNSALVRQHVKAIVNVVPEPGYAQARKIDMEKAYGVPVMICRTACEALEWIVTHVNLPNLAMLDQPAVLQRLAELLPQSH